MDRLLSVKDVAELLNMSPRMVYEHKRELGGFYPAGIRILRFHPEANYVCLRPFFVKSASMCRKHIFDLLLHQNPLIPLPSFYDYGATWPYPQTKNLSNNTWKNRNQVGLIPFCLDNY